MKKTKKLLKILSIMIIGASIAVCTMYSQQTCDTEIMLENIEALTTPENNKLKDCTNIRGVCIHFDEAGKKIVTMGITFPL